MNDIMYLEAIIDNMLFDLRKGDYCRMCQGYRVANDTCGICGQAVSIHGDTTRYYVGEEVAEFKKRLLEALPHKSQLKTIAGLNVLEAVIDIINETK